ncbi:MAG: biotin/lipoyl-containing protein [Fuerstiella sp.]
MDEQSFLDRVLESPGDIPLLREFAQWLITHDDLRGQHLAAELDVYDAELALAQADTQLSNYRGNRPQDFRWLNSVSPMITKAPLDGIFYSSLTPDRSPCVEPGTFCSRDTVVGVVEARKIFYHIPAGHSGMVTDVFVSNGVSVAAGDVLVKLIRPQKPANATSNSR